MNDKTFAQLVGNRAAIIVRQVHDGWDGHDSTGYTEDGAPYRFRHNFRHHELQEYLDVFARLGLTSEHVGLGEKATGFDDEAGYSFAVPECYALYVNDAKISDQAMKELQAEETRMAKQFVARMFGRPA